MSFENKNLYHLLGNDVEDDSVPSLPPKELVKKSTSSKKADVPPASADPAKAKKKTTKTTGNDAAFKNKVNNKAVNAPATPAKSTKKPFDRHSRTNKTDSKKKFKQGWGDNDAKRELDAETEGLQDAAAELAAEEGEAEPVKPASKSLQDYFEELKLKQQELTPAKSLRKANEGAETKWTSEEKIVKDEEVFVESTTTKKSKSKAQKEKKFLDIEAVFADEQPQPAFNKSGKKPFTGKKPFAGKSGKKPSAKPEINDKNFPSL